MDTRLLEVLDTLKKEESAQKTKKPELLRKEKRLAYYSGWTRKINGGYNMEDKEIGRIKKSESTEIIIRINEFEGKKGIDIREYVTTPKYTGWSKSGTRIPADKWEDFKKLINETNVE